MPMKLTEAAIAALECPPDRRDMMMFDTEQKGLGVRVTKQGGRVFILQWIDGATRDKRREVLGDFGQITLKQARQAAQARLGDVAKGIDPRAVRKAQEAAVKAAKAEAAFTLASLLDDWAKLHLAQRRERYQAEAIRSLSIAFDGELKRPASALSRAKVLQVVDAYDKAGKHATARLVRAYGRACFAWAVKRGKLASNPFQGLPAGVKSQPRERLLNGDEIGAIWNAACAMAEPYGPFIRLLMLSLMRREEVAAMKWSEISPDLTAWACPGSRMKKGAAHIVALSDAAREALGAITRLDGQDLVFSTTGKTPISGFSKVKARLDKASKVTGWVLHDFRRAGVSHLARLGHSAVLADALLAHKGQALSDVARVYQVHDFADERKAALEAWAAHVLRCASPEPEGNKVTSLAEHRAARAG
ncbi:MAG: integrase arm-type DNA-binding domain-containing protein [Roseomonas sp.]|nr:integrase arm-type DNA-binding domain-containing protein [Roseomonas sp.]